jgi:hemerythrin-like domain-containing protein
MFKLNEAQWQTILARMESIELEIQGLQKGLGLEDAQLGSAENGFVRPTVPLLESLKSLHAESTSSESENLARIEARLNDVDAITSQLAAALEAKASETNTRLDHQKATLARLLGQPEANVKAHAKFIKDLQRESADIRQHQSNEANMLLNALLGQLQAGSNAVSGQLSALPEQIAGQLEGVRQHQSNEANMLLNALLGQLQVGSNAVSGQLSALPEQIEGQLEGVRQHQSNEANMLLNAILGQLQVGSNSVSAQLSALPDRIEGQLEGVRQHQSDEANMLLNAILGQLQAGSNSVSGQLSALPDQIEGQFAGVRQHQSNEANMLLNSILGQLQAGSNSVSAQLSALPEQIEGQLEGVRQHQSNEANMLLNAIISRLQTGADALSGQLSALPEQIAGQLEGVRRHQSNEANMLLNAILGQIQTTANAQAETAASFFEQSHAALISQQALMETTFKASGVTDRARWKATASLVAPELTALELDLLNDYELSTDSTHKSAQKVAWPISLSSHMASYAESKDNECHIEPVFIAGMPEKIINAIVEKRDDTASEVDATIPTPDLEMIATDQMYPKLSITHNSEVDVKVVDYIVQIDTNRRFSSRNTLTYPRLAPVLQGIDLVDRLNVPMRAGFSSLRDYTASQEITFPFRVLAMAIDLHKSVISIEDLAALAHVLQVGLSTRDAIFSVFNYVRQAIFVGGNLVEVNPLDTLASGIGACGAMNDFAGALLELFGIRYRCVGGFNPTTRVFYPGGGHTAIEAWDGETWIYLDPYCDIVLVGGAAMFASSPVGHSHVIQPPSIPTIALSPELEKLFHNFTFAELFKYRIYGDKEMRSPMAWMLSLKGSEARQEDAVAYTEANYGLDWPLRPSLALKLKPNLPKTLTIYVRARCVVANRPIINMGEVSDFEDQEVSLGPWGYTQFTIRPRELYEAALHDLAADKPEDRPSE